VRFGSVCSGIEAASVAWGPLGWHAAWFSEIEPFPCAVLAHHYPSVPNYGDMSNLPTLIRAGAAEAPDILAGGTPCQAFSIAGYRESLADDRGNLTLTYCEILDAIDDTRAAAGLPAAISFWENVVGVFSTKDNAFGCLLGRLAGEDEALVPPGSKWPDAGCVYGPRRTVAWRTLDAQFFALAQRRSRVFVVSSARDDFDPAAVLLEFEGVRRDLAPSRGAGEDAAGNAAQGAAFGGNNTRGAIDVATAVRAKGGSGHGDFESETFVVGPLTVAGGPRAHGFGDMINNQSVDAGHVMPVFVDEVADPISAHEGSTYTHEGKTFRTRNVIAGASRVRRLTVTECERLQGFADGYTNVTFRGKKPKDGPRYAAIGNSWAVNAVRWIGRRIQQQLS
jgi:DNA (cytosine-5)-methyltransferase 1